MPELRRLYSISIYFFYKYVLTGNINHNPVKVTTFPIEVKEVKGMDYIFFPIHLLKNIANKIQPKYFDSNFHVGKGDSHRDFQINQNMP